MLPNVPHLDYRLETTRARPGQPAEGVIQVASRGLHAFCAPPHTLLVLVPYISQSAVPVQQLLCVGSRTVYRSVIYNSGYFAPLPRRRLRCI